MSKNKQYNSDTMIYYIAGTEVDGTDVICMQYSKAGNITAFDGYSDTILSRAGGGGYCKKSTGLSQALYNKYGIEIGGAGQGINVVIEKAKEQGYNIYDNYGLSELVYNANK